jgi:hypothetical protein
MELGKRTSYLVSQSCIQIQPTSWLEFILHTLGVGTSHRHPWTHLIHHGPDSREATTFPNIVFSVPLHHTCIRMAFFSRDSQSGVPKLSRFGLLGLWAFITSCLDLRLRWDLKQTCSFPWDLSNDMSHSTCTHRGRVNSWLLVVRSQTANLTLGPSFDHNLCCRCPNYSCEAIFDMTVWRTPQCKVFWPLQSSSEFLGVSKDSQVPFSGVWVGPHTSLKVGLRHFIY